MRLFGFISFKINSNFCFLYNFNRWFELECVFNDRLTALFKNAIRVLTNAEEILNQIRIVAFHVLILFNIVLSLGMAEFDTILLHIVKHSLNIWSNLRHLSHFQWYYMYFSRCMTIFWCTHRYLRICGGSAKFSVYINLTHFIGLVIVTHSTRLLNHSSFCTSTKPYSKCILLLIGVQNWFLCRWSRCNHVICLKSLKKRCSVNKHHMIVNSFFADSSRFWYDLHSHHFDNENQWVNVCPSKLACTYIDWIRINGLCYVLLRSVWDL